MRFLSWFGRSNIIHLKNVQLEGDKGFGHLDLNGASYCSSERAASVMSRAMPPSFQSAGICGAPRVSIYRGRTCAHVIEDLIYTGGAPTASMELACPESSSEPSGLQASAASIAAPSASRTAINPALLASPWTSCEGCNGFAELS